MRSARDTVWRWMVVLPLFIALLFTPALVWAVEDSLCFECHSDKGLVKIDESGKEVSLYMDKANWENSVHVGVSCVGCHTDLEDMEAEHAPKLQRVNCGQCHEEVDTIYQKSLHAEAIKREVKDSARCSDCHGSHYISPKGHILSKVNPLNLEETCDRCHADVAFVREHRGIPDRVLPGLISKESVHGVERLRQLPQLIPAPDVDLGVQLPLGNGLSLIDNPQDGLGEGFGNLEREEDCK